MKTSDKVLLILEGQQGDFVSGEAIGEELSLTRAAIWRAVAALRKEGYKIESSTKLGYKLIDGCDRLSAEGIKALLSHPLEVLHYKEVDSTNIVAKRLALEGAKAPLVVVAESQSGGRGRGGKAFFSPPASGLYLSLLIRPNFTTTMALRITAAASIAASRAIEEICGKEVEIKWVNDLFYNGKKVCGILTEGVSGFESGKLESVVIGLGINFKTPSGGFPDEIKEVATALYGDRVPQGVTKNRLAAKIIDNLLSLLSQLERPQFMDEYRQRSMVLNQEITVYHGREQYNALVRAITDEGGLIVVLDDGSERELNSGEISIRRV